MSGISTHVLDTSTGRPAAGVPVTLAVRESDGKWRRLGKAVTDADGRVRGFFTTSEAIVAGTYILTFDTGGYFQSRGIESFFPQAGIVFTVRDAAQNHHVPLLLSPYSYSTYRGG